MRNSIYSSVQMSHLQNCVMILNLKVLRMDGEGFRWLRTLVRGRRNWGGGMWHSGRGEKHCQCLGNPSGALSMKGCPSVYLVWFWGLLGFLFLLCCFRCVWLFL